jgi:hypothetical protein
MRLPRLRFSVQGLMVVVAVVAALLGLYLLKQRRDRYLNRVMVWRSAEESILKLAQSVDRRIVQFDGEVKREQAATPRSLQIAAMARELQDFAAGVRSKGEQAASIRRKYERAARYPWLPVSPDPPEPG